MDEQEIDIIEAITYLHARGEALTAISIYQEVKEIHPDSKVKPTDIQGAAFEPAASIMRGEPIWNTAELTRNFEVLGFMAPFVVVRRRSDGKRGTLQFTHMPRWYFNWQEE